MQMLGSVGIKMAEEMGCSCEKMNKPGDTTQEHIAGLMRLQERLTERMLSLSAYVHSLRERLDRTETNKKTS